MRVRLFAVFLHAWLAATASAQGGLTASFWWGGQGSSPGQFKQPFAVAVSPSGIVYVTDPGNYRVQAFTLSGTYLFEWGSPGTGDGQFGTEMWGIAVTQSGDVLVTDHTNFRVQRFSASGTYLSQWGTRGAGPGEFEYVYGIAVDASGHIYVADFGNFRVQVFTNDGAFTASYSLDGRSPIGLAVDRNGVIYATIDGPPLLVSLSPTGDNLGGWSVGDFAQGVGVGPDGIIYVGNTSLDVLQAYRPSGVLVGTWGGPGTSLGKLSAPIGVAFGPDGTLYVAERGNNRVL